MCILIKAPFGHMQNNLLGQVVCIMPELTSDPIIALAPTPEPVAPSLPKLLIFWETDQLVPAMGKSALFSIVAVA